MVLIIMVIFLINAPKCTVPHCSDWNNNNTKCEECQLPYYLDKSTHVCVQECKAKNLALVWLKIVNLVIGILTGVENV